MLVVVPFVTCQKTGREEHKSEDMSELRMLSDAALLAAAEKSRKVRRRRRRRREHFAEAEIFDDDEESTAAIIKHDEPATIRTTMITCLGF